MPTVKSDENNVPTMRRQRLLPCLKTADYQEPKQISGGCQHCNRLRNSVQQCCDSGADDYDPGSSLSSRSSQRARELATLKTVTQSAPHPLSTSVVPMIRSIPHPQFSGFLVARARKFVIIHLVLLPSPGTPTQVASREPKHSPGWEQPSISFNAHAANTGAIATLTQLLFPS